MNAAACLCVRNSAEAAAASAAAHTPHSGSLYSPDHGVSADAQREPHLPGRPRWDEGHGIESAIAGGALAGPTEVLEGAKPGHLSIQQAQPARVLPPCRLWDTFNRVPSTSIYPRPNSWVSYGPSLHQQPQHLCLSTRSPPFLQLQPSFATPRTSPQLAGTCPSPPRRSPATPRLRLPRYPTRTSLQVSNAAQRTARNIASHVARQRSLASPIASHLPTRAPQISAGQISLIPGPNVGPKCAPRIRAEGQISVAPISQPYRPFSPRDVISPDSRIIGGGPGSRPEGQQAPPTNPARRHDGLDRVTATLADLNMYCEAQQGHQCGVHALNAMVGRRLTTGTSVMRFLRRHWPAGQDGDYGPTGYTSTALNVWIGENCAPAFALVASLSTVEHTGGGHASYDKARILSSMPPGVDRFMLWVPDYGGHYVCIRHHRATDMWYYLDSMDSGVTKVATALLDDDWRLLRGVFYFAAAIDPMLIRAHERPFPRETARNMLIEIRGNGHLELPLARMDEVVLVATNASHYAQRTNGSGNSAATPKRTADDGQPPSAAATASTTPLPTDRAPPVGDGNDPAADGRPAGPSTTAPACGRPAPMKPDSDTRERDAWQAPRTRTKMRHAKGNAVGAAALRGTRSTAHGQGRRRRVDPSLHHMDIRNFFQPLADTDSAASGLAVPTNKHEADGETPAAATAAPSAAAPQQESRPALPTEPATPPTATHVPTDTPPGTDTKTSHPADPPRPTVAAEAANTPPPCADSASMDATAKPGAAPRHPHTELTILTWNVRGLTRVTEELTGLIGSHDPDILVLTETKLTDRLHGKLYVRESVAGYAPRYSSVAHHGTPAAGDFATPADGDNNANNGGHVAEEAQPHTTAPATAPTPQAAPATPSPPDRSGRAGVIVALARRHTHRPESIKTIPAPKQLRGHVQITLVSPPNQFLPRGDPPSQPTTPGRSTPDPAPPAPSELASTSPHPLQMIVAGVYMPCNDDHTRDMVIDHIISVRAAYPHATMVISGDMNMAPSHPKIRRLCEEACAQRLHLASGPCGAPTTTGDDHTRAVDDATHISDALDGTHREIDMIFISTPTLPGCNVTLGKAHHATLPHAGISDHTPLLTAVQLQNLPYYPPTTGVLPDVQPRVVYPIKQSNLLHFKRRVKAALGDDLEAFAMLARSNHDALTAVWDATHDYMSVREALTDKGSPHQWIRSAHDDACRMLTTIVDKMGVVARECLDTYTPKTQQGGNAARYMPKTTQKKYRQLLRDCKYLNGIITSVKLAMASLPAVPAHPDSPSRGASAHAGTYAAWRQATLDKIVATHTAHATSRTRLISEHRLLVGPPHDAPHLPDVLPRDDERCHLRLALAEWLAPYMTCHKQMRDHMWKLKCEAKQDSYRRYCKRWRKIMARQPRKAYKRIFKQPATTHASEEDEYSHIPADMSVVKDPMRGDALTSDPERVVTTVTDFFKHQQAPVAGPRHGKYGDDDAYRNYPFNAPGAVDAFVLQPHEPIDRHQLEVEMTEELLYGDLLHMTMRRASKNKAPGPDGIPNELLRAMDDSFHEALHHFMVGVWFTTVNPWPNSNTVLLYKKGDPSEVANYRPIGLANTMYKLWTSMLTELFSRHAEQHQMLATCQEGFRPYRNTTRQLEMVVNVLEDARLHQQDVYMLYVDFTSAFNTTDHDKLLQIMYDIGFPAAAIENVKGIYQHAATCVVTPHGPTPPIPIQRGTIQGDTLSPFLFLVFIEPLLRWLRAGGRGYKFGCLREPERSMHQCTSPAYADDLLCLTTQVGNMEIQADKITAFNKWAHMQAKAIKCGATGIRYKTDGAANANPLSARSVAALQRSLSTLRIQGQPIPFLHPDKGPYPYLGVHLTPTLNYSHHYRHKLAELRDKCDKLCRSFASGVQSIKALTQCIIPSITYAFPILPFGLQEVSKMDGVLAKCAKQAFNIPLWVSNRVAHLTRKDGGLGVPSLNTNLHQLGVAALVKSLNDPGTLGVVTRALLEHQLMALQGLSPTDVPAEARFLRLAKTIMLAKDMGVQLTKFGTVMNNPESPLVSLLKQVTYDPSQLGFAEVIPTKVYRVLMQLGVTDLASLTTRKGAYMITTADLVRMYGARVKHVHKIALNTLTYIMNAAGHDGLTLPKCDSRPLPLPARKIARPHLLAELATASAMLPQSKASQCLLRSIATRQATLRFARDRRPLEGDEPTTPMHEDTGAAADARTTTRHGDGQSDTPDGVQRRARKAKPRRTTGNGWIDADPDYGKPDWVKEIENDCQPKAVVADGNDGDDDDNTQLLWHQAYRRVNLNRTLASAFSNFCKERAAHRRRKPRPTIPLTMRVPGAIQIPWEDISRAVAHAAAKRQPDDTRINAGHVWAAPRKRHQPALHTMRNFKLYARSEHVQGVNADASVLDILYGRQECVDVIIAEKLVKGERQYQVQWAPTVIMTPHLEAYRRRGYHPSATTCMADRGLTHAQRRTYAGSFLRRLTHVTWQPAWEIASNLQETQPEGFLAAEAAFMQRKQDANAQHARTAKRMRRHDDNLPGPAKLGHGTAPPPPPVMSPRLRRHVHVCTNPINPDMDVSHTGCYVIAYSGTHPVEDGIHARGDCKVYRPDGRYVGAIPARTLLLLYARHRRAAAESALQPRSEDVGEAVMPTHPVSSDGSCRDSSFARNIAHLLERYAAPRDDDAPLSVPPQLVHALHRSASARAPSQHYKISELTCNPLTVASAYSIAFSDLPEDSFFGFRHDRYSVPWIGLNVACPPHTHSELDKAMRWAIGSAQRADAHGCPSATYMLLPNWPRSGSSFHTWMAHPKVTVIATLPAAAVGRATPTGPSTGRTQPRTVLLVLVANEAGLNAFYDLPRLRQEVMLAAANLGWHLPPTTWRHHHLDAATAHKAPLHGQLELTARQKAVLMFKLPTSLRKLPVGSWALTQHYAPSAPDAAVSMPLELMTPANDLTLRWQPTAILYTDGSCMHALSTACAADNSTDLPIHGGDRRSIGAAVYRPGDGATLPAIEDRLDPRGTGVTNTINRAELTAILHALRRSSDVADEVIATDSLCCLHWINRAMLRPQSLSLSKHKALVMSVVDELRRRASLGLRTSLVKVAAHTGVLGNERADALAKQAAQLLATNPRDDGPTADGRVQPQDTTGSGHPSPKSTPCDDHTIAHAYDVGKDPYMYMYWVSPVPTLDDKPPPPAHQPHTHATSTAGHSQPDATPPHVHTRSPVAPRLNYLGNLTTAVARLAYQRVGMATSNPSVYGSLMESELRLSDKHTNENMWRMLDSRKVTYKEMATSLRVRWGGIYTAKIAARMGRPYHVPTKPGKCPLCGRDDGATHIMGECPAHKHLHIERHNKVGRCILRHVRRGALGAFPVYADIGKETQLESDFSVSAKCIHDGLVPPPADKTDGTSRNVSKFDILIMHTRAEITTTSVWRDLPSKTGITAVEIGFRSDYDGGRKLLQKLDQHKHTCARLRTHYDLNYQVWDIGHTGMLPSRARLYAKHLGVADPNRLLRDVQAIAMHYAHVIMQDRRQQERHAVNRTNDTQTTTPPAMDHTSVYRFRPIGQKRTRAPPR